MGNIGTYLIHVGTACSVVAFVFNLFQISTSIWLILYGCKYKFDVTLVLRVLKMSRH